MTITDEVKLMQNTIEMLQKTLNDMIDRKASKNEMRLVLETIHEKQDILNELNEKLKGQSNPLPENGLWEKYTYKQPYYSTAKDNLFDEEKVKEYLNKCDIEKDRGYYKPKSPDRAPNRFNNVQFHMKDEDIHDEISKRNWVKRNMFLIKWPDKNAPVKEYDFIGFYENSDEKSIFITAKDFTSAQSDGMFVFSKYLKEIFKPGTVKIEYLDCYGKMMYGEAYSGCEIKEVNRTPMTYNSDSVVEIEVKITYDNKTFYDTALKEE